MPTIPTYEQQILPSQGLTVGDAPVNRSGEGLQDLGYGVRRLGHALEQKRVQREEQEGRIWAANAAGQADLAQQERLTALQNEAAPGASGFTQGYLQEFDEYSTKAVANAPSEYARDLLTAHLAGSREMWGRSAMGYEADERARYQGQQIDDGIATSAKLAYANPDMAGDEIGKWGAVIKGLAVPPEARQALLQNTRSIAWHATLGDIDQDPTGWQPGGEAWDVLSAEDQARASNYAEQKAGALRQDFGISLRQETQNAEAMARTGIAPTDRARTPAEFAAAYQDPRVAEAEYARYATARETAAAVSTMKGAKTTDLLAVLNRQPDADDPQFATTAEGIGIQQRAAAEIVQARYKDPVAYAVSTGDFGIGVLDPSQPEAFAAELSKRAAALPGMLEKYGTASVLGKDEASSIAQGIATQPADQKVSSLLAMRASLTDDTVYGSVMEAISKDAPVTALVGNIANAGAAQNARMIARGQDLLKPRTAGGADYPMPSESLLRSTWNGKVGDAYRGYPDAQEAAYQAFKAYYASAAASQGLGDPMAGVNTTIAAKAIDAATGGVARWSTDWFGNDTPSARVVLPYGMPADQFRDRVSAQWSAVREKAGYPDTDVGDVGLYNTGANGEYMVMSGESWLPDKDGNPIMLTVPAAK
jgi:hypothetical protein